MPTKPKKEVTKQAAVSRNAAKKKPRGKPFVAGDDTRRNENGQRNKEAVKTSAQYRDLCVELLHKPITEKPPADCTNLELIVWQHVSAARKGNASERELLLDRIWGKNIQPLDHTSSDGTMRPTAYQFVPYVKPDTDNP